jgi:hypothetical protein
MLAATPRRLATFRLAGEPAMLGAWQRATGGVIVKIFKILGFPNCDGRRVRIIPESTVRGPA